MDQSKFVAVVVCTVVLCMDLVVVTSSVPVQGDNPQPDPISATQPPQQHRHRHRHGQHPQLTCPEGQFVRVLRDGGEECTPCSICTEGFGVKLRCDEQSDTTCEACITGQTYRRNYFGVIKCLKCKACDNRVVIKECTAESDRVCGACKPGYFLDDMTDTCIHCSYCYPEVPNYGVVEPMCQTEHQPREMTCLPSLSPFRHNQQHPSTTPSSVMTSVENKLQFLEEKLQRLQRTVSGELREVMEELDRLKTGVTASRT